MRHLGNISVANTPDIFVNASNLFVLYHIKTTNANYLFSFKKRLIVDNIFYTPYNNYTGYYIGEFYYEKQKF